MLIREYIESVITELKIDRKFLSRLKSSKDVSPFVDVIVKKWIENNDSTIDISKNEKEIIISFAKGRYETLMKKYGDEKIANRAIMKLLDIKFAPFMLRLYYEIL